MASWKISDGRIWSLSELSDSLERDLAGLESSIMALDFDAVVRDNTRENNRPHSVDAICTNGRGLYYIEFKAERKESMDEISEGYRSKAMESPLLCDRFLSTRAGCYRELIIVTQDSRDALVLGLTQNSSKPLPKQLAKLSVEDRNGQKLYYDKISYWPCRRFVDYANRNMTNSDAAGIRTMLCRDAARRCVSWNREIGTGRRYRLENTSNFIRNESLFFLGRSFSSS